jgi:hypothetical protein
MKNLTLGLVLSLGLITTAASAATTTNNGNAMNSWFIGLGANHDAVTSEHGYGLQNASSVSGNGYDSANYNGGNVGFNLFVGKNVTDNFSVSLTYSQAGKSTYNVQSGNNTADLSETVSGTYISGAYAIPVFNNVEVSAIAGVGYFSATQTATVTGGSWDNAFASGDVNGFDYLYGFGMDYRINQLKVGASYLVPGNTSIGTSMLNLNFSYYL